jgi:hypothetical protein
MSICIMLAPFLCHLSRAASTQLKSSVDIYIDYEQVGNLSEHARRKSIWRRIFRSVSWIYLVLKLIKQRFNERKLCNI